MKMHKSPWQAIIDGAVAGAVGSYVIGKFFEKTTRFAPKDDGGFIPPDVEQKEEQATETIARRVVEGLARRETRLDDEKKRVAGQIVHYGFGAAWGALYGATSESFPGLMSPVGAALLGTNVYAISDFVLLPAFGLAARAGQYRSGYHAYSWAAHMTYGLTVAATYRALSTPVVRPLLMLSAVAALLARARPQIEEWGQSVTQEPVIFEEPIETFGTEPGTRPSL